MKDLKDDGALVVSNAQGGKGSKMTLAYHLIPACVLKALAKVTHYGAYIRPYGPWNWLKVEPWDHYNHLQAHLNNWQYELAKDNADEVFIKDELEHALCRMAMLYTTATGEDVKIPHFDKRV